VLADQPLALLAAHVPRGRGYVEVHAILGRLAFRQGNMF